MNRFLAGALALVAVACVAGSANATFRFNPDAMHALPPGGSASIGSRTAAPFGAIVFCRREPSQCAVRGSSGLAVAGGRVVLSQSVMTTLQSVNSGVNRAIIPAADSGGPHADTWNVGGRTGDCEDFALAKRAALISRGFPSSTTLIATAKTAWGTRHAVLIVRTSGGDFVLDSRSGAVVPFRSAPYRWESVQSPANPRVWMNL